VTSTLVFEGDGAWREYVGDVQDWMTQSARAAAMSRDNNVSTAAPTSKQASATATAPTVATPPTARKKLSYKEQRELESLPAKIAELEAEQAEINKTLESGKIYASDPARAAQLGARHAEIEEAWLAAMERMESLCGA
jgi:ATP-binding cassette subfamily F protein uup